MLGIISKIFGGNKSEKDVKLILPEVESTNMFYDTFRSLTNNQLRSKTTEFKQRIKEYLTQIEVDIENKKQEAEALPVSEISGRDSIYKEVDALKKDRDVKIEEILKVALVPSNQIIEKYFNSTTPNFIKSTLKGLTMKY